MWYRHNKALCRKAFAVLAWNVRQAAAFASAAEVCEVESARSSHACPVPVSVHAVCWVCCRCSNNLNLTSLCHSASTACIGGKLRVWPCSSVAEPTCACALSVFLLSLP